MEKVTGHKEKMQLSASERKGIKFGDLQLGTRGNKDPQAVGKVLSERPVRDENLQVALGKIWCPIKGMDCKELGENCFMFTFLQAAGKRKALDEGPWMFGKDLVVMVEFDGEKTLDEIEFTSIPILGTGEENAARRDDEGCGGSVGGRCG